MHPRPIRLPGLMLAVVVSVQGCQATGPAPTGAVLANTGPGTSPAKPIGMPGTGQPGQPAAAVTKPAQPSVGAFPLIIGDAEGKPMVGARVQLFPSGDLPAGILSDLIGNAASSLVANGAGNLTSEAASRTRRVQAVRDLVTDTAGRVVVDLPPGRYNLLASSADGTRKAWRPGLRIAADGPPDAAAVTVRPTGRLEGRVRTADPSITDLLTAEAFIPGSSFQAKTTRDGRYVIEGIPEGQFEIFAWHPDLGEAYVDAASAVRVTGGQTTQVPDLVLQRPRPVLQGVHAVLGDQPLRALPPGADVELRGVAFGASKGKPFNVSLKGVPILDPRRLANDLIVIRIPEDAESGLLAIQVDGFESTGLPVRVIGEVTWTQPTLSLGRGEEPDWPSLIRVRDTEGRILDVSGMPDAFGVTIAFPDDASTRTRYEVTLRAGTLTGGTLLVTTADHLDPVPGQNPSPGPLPDPTLSPEPSPEPTPTPTPEPSPEPTPTQTPESSPEPTPTQTPEPSPEATPTPTPEPSPEPTPTPTPEPSPEPTPTPTPEPSPEPTPTPTPEPSPEPTPTPTPEPSPEPTPTPTPEPSPEPTPTPKSEPSPEPTPTPKPEPSPEPTSTPKPEPSPEPTATPDPDATKTPAPDETRTPDPDETETPAPGSGGGGSGSGSGSGGDTSNPDDGTKLQAPVRPSWLRPRLYP